MKLSLSVGYSSSCYEVDSKRIRGVRNSLAEKAYVEDSNGGRESHRTAMPSDCNAGLI